MAIFAIMAPPDNGAIAKAIAKEFPQDNYQVGPGQWLVAIEGRTAQQISEKLGIPGGGVGRAVVVSVGNYHGWHATDLWEWLKVKMGAHGG